MNKEKLPKFVKLKSSALRYRKQHDDYWRDGGHWKVGYKYHNGILFSKTTMWDLNDEELVEISEKEWREDNGQYVPTDDQLKKETYE